MKNVQAKLNNDNNNDNQM